MIRAALLCCLWALPASAQGVLDQAAAKRELFSTRAATVVVQRHSFLSDADVATLRATPQVATLKYYGALAASPAAGLQAEASTGAFNYHSLAAARSAAVAGCNAKRAGGPSCVVVADIVPRRFQDGRALTLSQDASRVVEGRDFRRAGPNAAFAISRQSGAWGLGDGPDAALARCTANGARDCQVVVSQ